MKARRTTAGCCYQHRLALIFIACLAALTLFIDLEVVWEGGDDLPSSKAQQPTVRTHARSAPPAAARLLPAAAPLRAGLGSRTVAAPRAPVARATPRTSSSAAVDVSPHVALGMSSNLLPSAMLAYVRSLHAVSTAEIVMFVDKLPDLGGSSIASEADLKRVRWEVFDAEALPLPWRDYHPSNARMFLYQRFLMAEGARRAAATPPLPPYTCIQISDVRDVTFQSDPFAGCEAPSWRGVHVNLEVPSIKLGSEPYNAKWVKDCYGASILSRISSNTVSCSGYLIGSALEMGHYVDQMAAELVKHGKCESNGIDQGVHNVLLYTRGESKELLWRKHSQAKGPVWTGGYATKGVYTWDNEAKGDAANMVAKGTALAYAVLHQYDRHDGLLAKLCRRWTPERKQCGKEADAAELAEKDALKSVGDVARCDLAQFEMRIDNDLENEKGGTLKDFTHMAAAQKERCCGGCLGDRRCVGWVFRKGGDGGGHCWLKRATGTVSNGLFVPMSGKGLVAALRHLDAASAPSSSLMQGDGAIARRQIVHAKSDMMTTTRTPNVLNPSADKRMLPPSTVELDCRRVEENGKVVDIPAVGTAGRGGRPLRLLVMLSPSLPEWKRDMGRTGEVIVLESLKRAVCELGWSMAEVVAFKWDSDPKHVEALCTDPSIDAVLLEWDEPSAAFDSPCRKHQPVLVPDFFGFAESKKHKQLELEHYITMHPIAGNTFIGYVFPCLLLSLSRTSRSSLAHNYSSLLRCYSYSLAPPPPDVAGQKKMQGLIWGKDANYFRANKDNGHTNVLQMLKSLTVKDLPADLTIMHTASVQLGHNRYTHIGKLPPKEWSELLLASRFVLGIGQPAYGPTALEALRHGCMFINPVYDSPVPARMGVPFKSQHEYLRGMETGSEGEVGRAYVCNYRQGDVDALHQCIAKAVQGPGLAPWLPPPYTRDGFRSRFGEVIRGFVKAASASMSTTSTF